MKYLSILLTLTTSALAATGTLSVSYDTGYDTGSRSLNAVACSDGVHGLETRYGYSVQSNIPNFPYIGGWNGIAGWNSASCGQCLSVTYNGKTIYVTAVDHNDQGVNLSQQAMNDLTNGQAVQLGRVNANVQTVDFSRCKLPHAKRGVGFEA
ncbi:MAG: hypothetical protein M1820_001561 [Bogoriella megaspora]|nr:MAG: hypothetical protein M1820_001561 [Bogoriella megaspora]